MIDDSTPTSADNSSAWCGPRRPRETRRESLVPEASRALGREQHEVHGAVSASILAPNPCAVCGDMPKRPDLRAQAVRAEPLARFLGGRVGVRHGGAPCATGGRTRQMPGGETSIVRQPEDPVGGVLSVPRALARSEVDLEPLSSRGKGARLEVTLREATCAPVRKRRDI